MSVATAASATRTQIRSSLSGWTGELSGDERDLFRAFVDETISGLRGPFLAHHPADEVLAHLESAFRFTLQRDLSGPKVAIRPAGKGAVTLACMVDQPFIVDTIRLFLRNNAAEYWGGFNLTFQATRDESGKLIAVGADDGLAESIVLLEADAGSLLDDGESKVKSLTGHLTLARALVSDFRPMTRIVERWSQKYESLADRHPVKGDPLRETAQFLQWLLADNFVFMGLDVGEDRFGIQGVKSAFLGDSDGEWPTPHEGTTIQVRKSRHESPVHRAGRIDEILISPPDDSGVEPLFIRGMFTYRAVTQPCRHVPILRRVLAGILDETKAKAGSYRYKGIANVFDSLPTEFLLTATREAIAETVDLVFEAEHQQDVGVSFLKTGPFTAFCLVAMPKSQYTDELRRDVETDITASLDATYCDHGLFVGRYDTVLLHYFLTGVSFPSDDDLQELTERIRGQATPWSARLWSTLAKRFDDATADRLAETYGRAFPDEWVRTTSADRAVRDIEMLERLSSDARLVADVYEDRNRTITLNLYEQQDVYLTDLLPVLDNFGLVVIESNATRVESRGGRLYIDTFKIMGAKGVPRTEFRERGPLLVDAIEAVFAKQVENDGLNQLVLASGLTWKEVDVLRGFANYSRQLQDKVSPTRAREIMLTHPIMCITLVELFRARFDPDFEGSREQAVNKCRQAVVDELRLIRAHDEDLLFSTLASLIHGTVRTNAYRTDLPFHYLSFKYDSSAIDEMGDKRAMFEIYVHQKDVEGVHLRFGKIARGGLRWSDRHDYRTEVFGLAATQVVKNVVIVPIGAKGGFLLKNASADYGIRRQEADHHYKTFIRGLLDVTDNVVNDKIVPPPRVVRHDPDDPYLVVAADKGTAHLSDTANALAVERGFWLGDAFASGGSNGYDHKGMGITARGAWVLVNRHFAELGVDPYSQEFTVAGIGDMSGDVFGNGLIETPHARLIAAFNHMHIFLDPDPDTAAAAAERNRLFEAGRAGGGWAGYNEELISEGGGVFDIRAKSVPLSPQAQKLLGLSLDEAPPEVVVNAILKMDVDLLWNGGIGTYMKASTETHGDADDRSNDAVRIDGNQIRAKILGEGGNLGVTQRGRIEAAQHGLRLNTDFIDNSAGVDLSDHEVNLKILLDRVVARGELDVDGRNAMLRKVADKVADLVLANNDAQGRQITRDIERSKRNIFAFGRAISFVERHLGVRRKVLRLPSENEINRRAETGAGLTRPELAVLSSWVKQYVFRELCAGEPKALPGYDELLLGYFPDKLVETYEADVRSHQLADEIAMTQATTRIVSDGGVTLIPMMIETTGRGVQAVASAYLKAQVLSRTEEVRSSLQELRSTINLVELSNAWVQVDDGTRQVAAYWLSAGQRIPTDDEMTSMAPAAESVYELQAREVTRRNKQVLKRLSASGIPPEVGARVLQSRYLNTALMVWAEAKRNDMELPDMAVRNLAVGRASGLQAILDDLAERPASGRWDPIALRILFHRFSVLLRDAVNVSGNGVSAKTVDALEAKLKRGALKDVRRQVDELMAGQTEPSVATLLVAEERVRGLLARMT
ncbi:MAG: NAD-glutamate dehydrogenase [Proteobacteria bacterium]|nr:NAD-glutamate dehydrogenase [Pseudomonadota bacterium]